MSLNQSKTNQCAVMGQSKKPCAGEIHEVFWSAGTEGKSAVPEKISLCQYHHQLELLVWGKKRFSHQYPGLSGYRESPTSTKVPLWRKELELMPTLAENERDPLLNFSSPEDLEILQNLNFREGGVSGDFHRREDYSHLRETAVDLEHVSLTDKQLMAICLVFYGGVKKNRAARAMKITSQALGDHVKAALRKIQSNLCG